jgi:predicted enzyme related to lactoylglutathione lyase
MTVWSQFKKDTDYFGDAKQSFMLNYRVENLDLVLTQLRAEGVWVDEKRDDSEYGKFGWIKDCDGNRIELWEPPA